MSAARRAPSPPAGFPRGRPASERSKTGACDMDMHDLEATDPDIADLIRREEQRQFTGIELIASENYVSAAVAETMSNIMTDKYAEGLPGKRYYGGCEFVDQAETLAIE